nr:hypothetical protein [Tanacetum cinerariifolium]
KPRPGTPSWPARYNSRAGYAAAPARQYPQADQENYYSAHPSAVLPAGNGRWLRPRGAAQRPPWHRYYHALVQRPRAVLDHAGKPKSASVCAYHLLAGREVLSQRRD